VRAGEAFRRAALLRLIATLLADGGCTSQHLLRSTMAKRARTFDSRMAEVAARVGLVTSG
jgi:hypothetical protein